MIDIHLLAASRGIKCGAKPISSENEVTIWELLKLVLYILKQLFASVSVNSGDIYCTSPKRLGKISTAIHLHFGE